jgi:hypothetical protein
VATVGSVIDLPLTQITPENVASLQVAWTFDAGASNLQVTPIVVGGRMYVSAGSTIVALEPETAKVLWKFDAQGVVSRRGVAYWPGNADNAPRLFSGVGDRMVALDAATGVPVASFGAGGFVDLKQGVRGDVDGRFRPLRARPPGAAATGGGESRRDPGWIGCGLAVRLAVSESARLRRKVQNPAEIMVSRPGIEPGTRRLRVCCSAN